MKASRFAKGSGVFKCAVCKRLTRSTGRNDNEHVGNCAECYDLAGEANTLSDTGDFYDTPARVIEMIERIASKGGDVSEWDELRAAAERRLA